MQLPRFIRPLLPLFPLLLRWSSALTFLPLALSTLLAVLLQIFIGTVLMGLQLCEGSVVMLVALIMPCPGLVPLSILHGLEKFPIPVLGVNTHVLQCSEWAVSVSVAAKPEATDSEAIAPESADSEPTESPSEAAKSEAAESRAAHLNVTCCLLRLRDV